MSDDRIVNRVYIADVSSGMVNGMPKIRWRFVVTEVMERKCFIY